VNTDADIKIKNDSSYQLTVYTKAKGFALFTLLFRSPVTLNLDAKEDVTTYPNHYIFDSQKNTFLIEDNLGTSYEVLSIKPDTLAIRYDKLMSKTVAVTIDKELSYTAGFDIVEILHQNMDSVKIIGASDELAKINVVQTEALVKKNINTNFNSVLNIINPSPSTIEIIPKQITVNAHIERFTEGTLEIPVELKNIPDDITINYFPKKITVFYYLALKDYKTIKPSDFKVVCDYNTITNNQPYMIPKIIAQPETVKRATIKQQRIDFIKL